MPDDLTETFQFPVEETMTTETRNIHQRIDATRVERDGVRVPGKAARCATRDALPATSLLQGTDAEDVRHLEEA